MQNQIVPENQQTGSGPHKEFCIRAPVRLQTGQVQWAQWRLHAITVLGHKTTPQGTHNVQECSHFQIRLPSSYMFPESWAKPGNKKLLVTKGIATSSKDATRSSSSSCHD